MPKLEGGETMYVSPDMLREKGIVLSKTQAKQLLKVDKPKKPRSEAQMAHIQAVVQRNKERALLRRKEKEAEQKEEEQKMRATAIPITVATGKGNPRKTIKVLSSNPSTIVEDEEDEEPQRIQAVKKVSKKAKELMDEMEELDEKIHLLKNRPLNRYAHLLQF
jgi:vacuolar-type H+-ATPase subunit I/STV1